MIYIAYGGVEEENMVPHKLPQTAELNEIVPFNIFSRDYR